MRTVLTGIACALLAAGCGQSPPNDVVPCPTLFSRTGSFVGFLGPPGELDPGQCVELYVDGRQRAVATANPYGAFFTEFPLEYQEYDKPIDMRIDGLSYTVFIGGPTRAPIDYTPETTPLQETDEGGRARVRVQIDRWGPTRAYTVNQSCDLVEPLVPLSSHDQAPPTSRTMTGVWGERCTVVTEHLDGTGGCWWPGGGEIIQCSNARWASDRCQSHGGSAARCEHGRGCSVIHVEEQHSGIGRLVGCRTSAARRRYSNA